MGNRAIFTAAAAACLAASAAHGQSNVQLYGTADAMVYSKQLAGEKRVSRVDSGGLTTSFWGVRGSEDLGGGLRAEFDLSSFFRLDAGNPGRNDADPFFARSSWIGLQDRWGTLRLGRQSTLAFLNLVRFNSFGGSSVFSPSFIQNYQSSATQPLMTPSGTADSSWNNTIGYTTPAIGGLTASVFYAPSESTTVGRRLGASASFVRGPFAAGVAAETIQGMNLNFSKPPAVVSVTDSRLVNLGASYDFGVAKLFAQAIHTELRSARINFDFDSYNVGASIPAGAGQVKLSYGVTTREQTALADQKRRTFSIGYDYYLSKRTNLYGVALNDRATGLTSGTGVALGVRHVF